MTGFFVLLSKFCHAPDPRFPYRVCSKETIVTTPPSDSNRMTKVFDYIDAHLDQNLSMEELSTIGAYSVFHFHRQFSAHFGLSCFTYVQLCRMKSAAAQLAFRPEKSVIEIAQAHGYDEPESFSRAFKKHTGQAPSDFRQSPQWEAWYSRLNALTQLRKTHMPLQFNLEQVELIAFKAMPIAIYQHKGSPALLPQSIRHFIQWRKEHKLSPARYATFNLLYQHPEEVAPEDFRFDLATQVDSGFTSAHDHIIRTEIPAGLCARLRLQGSDDGLENAIHFLYANWLPQSGKSPRDFPLFLQRLNFFPDVAENELITDLYLPLQ